MYSVSLGILSLLPKSGCSLRNFPVFRPWREEAAGIPLQRIWRYAERKGRNSPAPGQLIVEGNGRTRFVPKESGMFRYVAGCDKKFLEEEIERLSPRG